MERSESLLKKAPFVMDRGYNDNKMFLKPDSLGQDYVIDSQEIISRYYTKIADYHHYIQRKKSR